MIDKAVRNPWSYVPLMYFLQALPVSLVQDVATVVYKDLGVANETIIQWTALVALPWSLQMFFGPLVDLTETRRRWVVRSQTLITAALMAAPFLLRLPRAFELSLAAFLVASLFSTICNAAQDGFYLLALPKGEQARFAGVQSTCYKLGTLFMKGLLVYVAGHLMAFGAAEVRPSTGGLEFTVDKERRVLPEARLTVQGLSLTDEKGNDLDPPMPIGPDTASLRIGTDGKVTSAGRAIGTIALSPGARLSEAVTLSAPASRRDAWTIVLLFGALVYGGLYLVERRAIPRPVEDIEAESSPGELQRNVLRTASVVGLGIAGYFVLNALVRLGANALWALRDGTPDGPLKGWRLAEAGKLIVFPVPGPGADAEILQLVVAGAASAVFFLLARRTIRGSAMGTAFASFFAQPGIVAILSFLMFYRFSEAMIMRLSPLFLKDPASAGGLGFRTEDVGTIKGVVGVFGIVLGGILGGLIVSRAGLRRTIWPIAILMHLPGLLYLWASHALPGLAPMYGVDFVEQFGYGFGYAGYTIILQRIAQRGNFRTAHYALGVGVGALFSQVAGVLGGVLQANFGYQGFFLVAVILAVPGLATLLFLPLDEPVAA